MCLFLVMWQLNVKKCHLKRSMSGRASAFSGEFSLAKTVLIYGAPDLYDNNPKIRYTVLKYLKYLWVYSLK